MSSPFDARQNNDGNASRHEDFYVRSLNRRIVTEKRVNTRWKANGDILWQLNPDRILKYRPNHLHYYGWMPVMLRNIKATVFGDVYFHVQNFLFLGWMIAIHLTGLGVHDQDLGTLVTMFGTPYLGAIFNYSMVMTFILGLFVTLVINRWIGIRAAYAKLMGTTTDLCITIANVIRSKDDDPNDRRIRRARTEITRLLNLGHLLVIAKADAQNEEFKKSKGLRTAYRVVASNIQHTFKKSVLSPRHSGQSGSPRYTEALFKPRTLLTFETMVNEGLMNEDEWTIINEAEDEGMPGFQMVYYWTQNLINKCNAEDWLLSANQMLPLLLNKINVIVESGSAIITTINSQLPYPYVHLVSFVVHMYLIVLSTWFGCFLHTGRAGEQFLSEGVLISKAPDKIETSAWMVFWCYLLMFISVTMCQGLLDMHTLLDNPFGNHVAKFALRANVSTVSNASRAMLKFADRLPAAFGDVFQSLDGEHSLKDTMSGPRSTGHQEEFADFLKPAYTGQLPIRSLGSYTAPDRSKGKSFARQKSRFVTAEIPMTTVGEGHESKLAPKTTATSIPQVREELCFVVYEFQGSEQGKQTGGEQSNKSGGEQSNKSGGEHTSGDAAMKERFLQGAVRQSMSHLKDKDPAENV